MLPRSPYADAVDARDVVAAAIRDHGPISFAEYMEIALSDPAGSSNSHRSASRGIRHEPPRPSGLRAAPRAGSRTCGGSTPRPFRPRGRGDGRSRALLEHLRVPDVVYTAVETSPGARRALSAIEGHARSGLDVPRRGLRERASTTLPFRRPRHEVRRQRGPGRAGRRSLRRGSGGGPPDRDVAIDDGEEVTILGSADVRRRGGRPARPPRLRAADRRLRGGRAGRPAARVPRASAGRGSPRPPGSRTSPRAWTRASRTRGARAASSRSHPSPSATRSPPSASTDGSKTSSRRRPPN